MRHSWRTQFWGDKLDPARTWRYEPKYVTVTLEQLLHAAFVAGTMSGDKPGTARTWRYGKFMWEQN